MTNSKILLVEDDAIIASGLCYALEQEGCAVTHSASVRDARLAAENEHFDLALLDMQLPVQAESEGQKCRQII